MINKEEIIQFFEDNGLEHIEEIECHEGILILRCSYKFDKVEIEAAEAYANEECEEEKKGEEWNYEFFLPYLNDIAVDNVSEIIEECSEEIETEYQFIALDVPMENPAYNDFLVVFNEEEKKIDLEDFLEHIM